MNVKLTPQIEEFVKKTSVPVRAKKKVSRPQRFTWSEGDVVPS